MLQTRSYEMCRSSSNLIQRRKCLFDTVLVHNNENKPMLRYKFGSVYLNLGCKRLEVDGKDNATFNILSSVLCIILLEEILTRYWYFSYVFSGPGPHIKYNTAYGENGNKLIPSYVPYQLALSDKAGIKQSWLAHYRNQMKTMVRDRSDQRQCPNLQYMCSTILTTHVFDSAIGLWRVLRGQ